MQNTDSPQVIQIPAAQVSTADLIQQLSDENFQLRQIIAENNIVIDRLTNSMAFQYELIQQLRDEIAILKGQKPKPKIPPSGLEGSKSKKKWPERFKKILQSEKSIVFAPFISRFVSCITPSTWFHASKIANANAALQTRAYDISRLIRLIVKKVKRKRSKPGQPNGKPRNKKKGRLEIHNRIDIHPENIPQGAVFKGYKPYLVQDIIFQSYNTLYRRGQWLLPDGSYLTGLLPEEVNGHYGPELKSFMIFQNQVCRVTEPLLHQQLRAKKLRFLLARLMQFLQKI